MDVTLFLVFFLFGIFSFLYENWRLRNNILLVLIFFSLYVATSISRIYGYHSYSDLGAYLWRFENGEVSYFGVAYDLLTKAIRFLFGNNPEMFIFSIASIIFGLALVTIIQWEKDEDKDNVMVCAYMFIFMTYWGMCFSTEVIRSGLAISLSLCSLSFAKNKNWVFSFFLFILALFLHWTNVFFAFIILKMLFEKKEEENFEPDFTIFQLYYVVLFLLILFDFTNVSSVFARIISNLLKSIFKVLGNKEHYSIYAEYTTRNNFFDFISLQYIFYRILACVLVYMCARIPIAYKENKLLLNSYFLGLVIFTIMNNFAAVTRMQWIFQVPSCLLIYNYMKYGEDLKSNMYIIIMGVIGLQAVMAISYLK